MRRKKRIKFEGNSISKTNKNTKRSRSWTRKKRNRRGTRLWKFKKFKRSESKGIKKAESFKL